MHLRFVSSALALAIALVPAVADARSKKQQGEWKLVEKDGALKIYNRNRPGSDLKELKAVGVINAPPWVCKNVVDDVARFKEFMPYTERSDLLWEDKSKGSKISYQYLDMPFISDRDYTIFIQDQSVTKKDGTIRYRKTWKPANSKGPKEKSGVVRLKINEGYWQFESMKDPNKSKVTYYVYTDPGGALPAFIVNKANTTAIPNLFEAIEEQAADGRYRKEKPTVHGDPPKAQTPPPAPAEKAPEKPAAAPAEAKEGTPAEH